MSKIGKKNIIVPKDSSIKIEGSDLTITGPKGTTKLTINDKIFSSKINQSEFQITPIDKKIDKEDLLIYLSGSGNSINLVKCARKAKQRNIKQAALTGFNGGALNKIVDYPIHIKFDDMEICEDLQLSIFHYIKQRLISKYSDNFANCELPKYQKRTLEDLIS